MGKINHYSRHQKDYLIIDLFPIIPGLCSCGCMRKLVGRRTRWSSTSCARKAGILFLIISGHVSTIRRQLFKRDRGVCSHCMKHCILEPWYADHILAVCNGGGGCGLNNFATLCKTCHKIKTKKDLLLKNLQKKPR